MPHTSINALAPELQSLAVAHAAGFGFEVCGGVPQVDRPHEAPLPMWALSDIAQGLGVTDGRITLPTGEQWQADAKQAREQSEHDMAHNPWKQGPSFNVTKQFDLMRTDPERAARLKAAAIA